MSLVFSFKHEFYRGPVLTASVSSDTEMRALVWRTRHCLNSETSMTRMFPMVLDAGTESDAKRTTLTRQGRILEPAQTSHGDREEYDCQKWEIWAQRDA